MNSTDPRVELVPADFVNPVAECYDLFYTGVKGARIHAKLLKPRDITEPTPAILHFHGYSGNSGDWHNHLAYAASGFTVAAMDCRGQGGLSEDRGGVFGNTLEDILFAVLTIRTRIIYCSGIFSLIPPCWQE